MLIAKIIHHAPQITEPFLSEKAYLALAVTAALCLGLYIEYLIERKKDKNL